MVIYRDGLAVATNVTEAAAWHKSVRVSCAYGHVTIFNGDGLWWLCERRGLPHSFAALRDHLYCSACWRGRFAKVRPRRIEACDAQPTAHLPHPPESEARKAAKRFR